MTNPLTNDASTRLASIGDALERAAGHDLAREHAALTDAAHTPQGARATGIAGGRWRSLAARHPRRFAATLGALVVLIPGGAIAATQLFSNGDVAASIPAGTLALLNTNPTCTTVTAGVEYHCTLAGVPSDQGGPAAGQWLGTVEPTVDATKHVNGGCRSLNAAGTEWECYIGQKAVAEKIIGAGFLGQFSPSPGVG